MEISIYVAHEDMDLLTEFYGKIVARQKARDDEEDRQWEARKAEKTARTVDATEVEITPAPAPAPTSEVTEQEATDTLHKYVAKKGAPAAVAMFSDYGAKRLGDVPVDRRAELVARMKEAL